MNNERRLSCVISGSFEKFKPEIDKAIDDFTELGVNVIAPEKGWLYRPPERRADTPFRPLKSEISMTIKEIEEAFLRGIDKSDFVYIVNPDGYIGSTVAFEIGYATRGRLPLFAREHFSRFIDSGSLFEIISEIKIVSPEEVVANLKSQASKSS